MHAYVHSVSAFQGVLRRYSLSEEIMVVQFQLAFYVNFFFANRNGRYQQLLLECKCTFFSISYASTRKKSMNRIKRHFKTECCNIHQPANNLFRLNQMHKTNDENSFETFFLREESKVLHLGIINEAHDFKVWNIEAARLF